MAGDLAANHPLEHKAMCLAILGIRSLQLTPLVNFSPFLLLPLWENFLILKLYSVDMNILHASMSVHHM